MNLIQSFFRRLNWRFRSWLRWRSETAALRRFERERGETAAICENCRKPFDPHDDDVILTPDACWLCAPCANVIDAIAVAS